MAAAWNPSGARAPAALTHLLREEFAATDVQLFVSGTAALASAIRSAVRIRPTHPALIALPAFACFAVAAAAVSVGHPLIFYDVDPETLAPDQDSFEGALAEGATVAVLAPLFGMGFPIAPWQSLAGDHGAVVIEDAAQTLDATAGGVAGGVAGELSVLSFGRGKGWTGGAGGVVLGRGRFADLEPPIRESGVTMEFQARMRLMALWALGRPAVYGLPARLPLLHLGETRWADAPPPLPLPRSAAATIVATRVLRQPENAVRRAHAARLLLAVSGSLRAVRPVADAAPSYLRLALRAISQDAVTTDAARLGVARTYPCPLPELAQVAALRRNTSQRWSGADELARTLITVPTHGQLRERDLVSLERFLAGGAT